MLFVTVGTYEQQFDRLVSCVDMLKQNNMIQEDVNDHQLSFCREVADRLGNILLVEETENLLEVITRYDTIVSSMNAEKKQ